MLELFDLLDARRATVADRATAEIVSLFGSQHPGTLTGRAIRAIVYGALGVHSGDVVALCGSVAAALGEDALDGDGPALEPEVAGRGAGPPLSFEEIERAAGTLGGAYRAEEVPEGIALLPPGA